MAEWDADITVDADALHRAAGSPRAWRLLGSGWDCDAYLAEESIVWRVPRRAIAEGSLRLEAALMPVIAPHLPNEVRVGVPELVQADGLPLMARHTMVPGREFAGAPRVGARVGETLGRFLRALHAPQVAAAAAGIAAIDPLGRADIARRLRVVHARLDAIADRIDVAPLRAIVDPAEGITLPLDVLCHGDLHIRHLMLDPAGELCGVIDWGDACICARALDLLAVTALDADQRAGFFAAYGAVDEPTWRFARMLGVTLAASLLAADPHGESGRGAWAWLETLAALDAPRA